MPAQLGGVAACRRGRENDPVEAQRLTERPSLERAAAWCVGRIPVSHLRQVTQSCRVEMLEQRVEELTPSLTAGCGRVAPRPHPGLDERSKQPGPHGPLVI